jgi:Ca2+-binding RTX toxin-like protein
MKTSTVGSTAARTISDEQKKNIRILFNDIESSIDQDPDEDALKALKTEVKDAVSDRSLTKNELKGITQDLITVIQSTGITPEEARTIFYDLQDIAEASNYPRTDDTAVGDDGDDILWTGLGNDTLRGASSAKESRGDVDWLCGGGGNDTFILGDSTGRYYDDGKDANPGLSDYAAILDFNRKRDTVQLVGQSSNYTLAEIPQDLGITGTAIYYTGANSVPEIIGVLVGVTVNNFDKGFSFV